MDKIDELQKKIRENSLVISRVPKKTKEAFIALANEEFCGDYGMLLRDIFEQAMEYQAMKITFFENMEMKLNNILENVSQIEQKENKEKSPTEGITLLDGRRIDKGGKKHG